MDKINIYVVLRGGLGNQLFQYACAKAITLTFAFDGIAFIDTAYRPTDSIGRENYLKLLLGSDYSSAESVPQDHTVITESNFLEILSEIAEENRASRAIVLNGYFQSSDFFLGMAPIIRDHLNTLLLTSNRPDHDDSISVHLRRFDYANFGLCALEYYIAVISEILEANNNSLRVNIFSDEPLVASTVAEKISMYLNLNLDVFYVGRENNPIKLLGAISNAKYLCIANSSLSWWSAFLANETIATVFCPSEPWILDNPINPAETHWYKIEGAVADGFSFKIRDQLVKDFVRQIQLQNFRTNHNKLCCLCRNSPRVRINLGTTGSYSLLCEWCIVTANTVLNFSEKYTPEGLSLAALVPALTEAWRK